MIPVNTEQALAEERGQVEEIGRGQGRLHAQIRGTGRPGWEGGRGGQGWVGSQVNAANTKRNSAVCINVNLTVRHL